ncbi:type II secretion system F family protein [Numidum massiliense]|uniref:type II secretion system F family protein n=1 Tax=Numidum massiliense TaxID=1522315 RepID=UPI0009E7F131|nr:type II secretion system F family protein [Numidum massiliense]
MELVDSVLLVVVLGLVGYLFYSIRQRKRAEREAAAEAAENEVGVAVNNTFADVDTVLAKKPHKQSLAERVKQLWQPVDDNAPLDYTVYHMRLIEYVLYALAAGVFFFFIGYIFYSSFIAAAIFALLGLFFPRVQKKKLLAKREQELGLQFKEAIASLSASLAAGRSTENSFREVVKDLRLLYPDPNTYIIREFELINRRVENGATIERALEDFARRTQVEDIINFVDVFTTCKRTGGDLVEVIRRTSDIISDKIDIQQEISVMVAQKRFESKILSVVPLGMILLLKYMAADYLEPLYRWSDFGPVVMTFCLLLLGASYWLSQRIMNIKV